MQWDATHFEDVKDPTDIIRNNINFLQSQGRNAGKYASDVTQYLQKNNLLNSKQTIDSTAAALSHSNEVRKSVSAFGGNLQNVMTGDKLASEQGTAGFNPVKDVLGQETAQPKGFLGNLFQNTIGSKGLAGVFQLPGKAIGEAGVQKDIKGVEETRANLYNQAASYIKQSRSAVTAAGLPDTIRQQQLTDAANKLRDQADSLADQSTNLQNKSTSPEQAIGTTLNATATVGLPGAAGESVAAKGIVAGAKAGAISGAEIGALQGAGQAMQNKEGFGGVAGGTIKGALGGAAAGGILGGITGGISNRFRGSFNRLSPEEKALDAVSPELKGKALQQAYTDVALGKRTVDAGGMLTPQSVSADARTIQMANDLAAPIKNKAGETLVDGVSFTNNPVKNLGVISGEFDKTEAQIQTILQGNPEIVYNLDKPTLIQKLDEVQTNAPEEFRIKDSQVMYDKVVNFGKKIINSSDDTIAGGREAATAFDNQAKREFPGAFKDGRVDIKTPAGAAIKEVRDAIRGHLYETAPEGTELKQLIGREFNLYRAADNVAAKAAKLHGETGLAQKAAKSPAVAKALKWTGFGLLAALAGSKAKDLAHASTGQ